MNALRTARSVTAIVVAGLTGLVACGDDTPALAPDPPDTTVPAPDDALDGTWRVTAGMADGAAVALIDGRDITLEIAGDRIAGTAACNGYGGTATFDEGELSVDELSWTEMGCEVEVMELEQRFLQALSLGGIYQVDGDTLVLGLGTTSWTLAR